MRYETGGRCLPQTKAGIFELYVERTCEAPRVVAGVILRVLLPYVLIEMGKRALD